MEELAPSFWTFLPPPFNVMVIVAAICAAGAILHTLVEQIGQYAVHRSDQQFKIELIQNGLSIEEAERWMALKVKEPRSSEEPMPKEKREEAMA